MTTDFPEAQRTSPDVGQGRPSACPVSAPMASGSSAVPLPPGMGLRELGTMSKIEKTRKELVVSLHVIKWLHVSLQC